MHGQLRELEHALDLCIESLLEERDWRAELPEDPALRAQVEGLALLAQKIRDLARRAPVPTAERLARIWGRVTSTALQMRRRAQAVAVPVVT